MVNWDVESADLKQSDERISGVESDSPNRGRSADNGPVRAILTDDRRLCRESMRLLIESMDPAFNVVEASGTSELGRLVGENQGCDLVLYNFVTAEGQGVEFVTTLTRMLDGIPLIVLSDAGEPALMRGVMERGARAYLPPTTAGPVLMAILRLVIAGGTYVPPGMVIGSHATSSGIDARAATGLRRETAIARNFPDLTPRQRNVLALLSQGLSNRDIAGILSMCENTVKAHVKQVMRKLKAENRTQAALMADRIVN